MMHVKIENNEYETLMDFNSEDYNMDTYLIHDELFGGLSTSDSSDSTTSDEDRVQIEPGTLEAEFLDLFNLDGIKDGSEGPTLAPSIMECNSPYSDIRKPRHDALSDVMNVKQECSDDYLPYGRYTDMDPDEDWLEVQPTADYEIKFPDTPPVTPPELTPSRDQSPPLSPIINQINEIKLPASKIITFSSPLTGNRQVLTVKKKDPLIQKIQPIKLISTTGTVKGHIKSILPKEKNVKLVQPTVCTRSPVIPRTISTADSVNIPLIITTKEAGDGRIQNRSLITKFNSTSVVSKVPLIAPATSSSMKQNNVDDLRAMKRQLRMIKNRESASLSRKKKKEYLQTIEGDNNILRKENLQLKERISSLERENALLRGISKQSTKKATTALYALTFLLTFNLLPLTQIFNGHETNLFSGDQSKSLSALSDQVAVNHNPSPFGRALLWFDNTSSSNQSAEILGNHSSICPLHINATESIRIKNELRGWFEPKSPPVKDFNLDLPKKVFHPKSRSARNQIKEGKRIQEEKNALASVVPAQSNVYQYLYGPHLQHDSYASRSIYMSDSSIERILGSIERRDDTYYVISLSKDHLLVPATQSDSSTRPKMSLLLPPNPKAMNQSKDSNQFNLVQIDCEVMSTKVVEMQEESIVSFPLTDSPKVNLTTADSVRKRKKNFRKSLAIK